MCHGCDFVVCGFSGEKIQQRVAALGFDWPTYHGAIDKVSE